MEYRRWLPRASSSDSETENSGERPIQGSGHRRERISFDERRVIRRQRYMNRSFAWSIFRERSLNLDTLFDEAQTVGLPTRPRIDSDERYAIRYVRQSRRRWQCESFAGYDSYDIDTLFADTFPVAVTPPQLPRDDFHDWAAGFGAAVADAHAVGGNDKEDAFGDAIAQAAAGVEVDWSRFVAPRFYIDESRTSFGACLVGARSDIRRALITAVVRIRHTSPGINDRVAWRQLVARLLRERVIVRESEAARMWTFAFNEAAGPHFRYIFEADFAVIYELWNHL